MSKLFYLRDTRSNVGSNATFWAKAGSYTTDLNKAELFTEYDALRQHKSRESDLPVEVDFLIGKTRHRIDCQHIMLDPPKSYENKYVVIVGGKWDGNDVPFVGYSGLTFELKEAKIFTLEEGCVIAATKHNYCIYPYDHLKRIARITVDAAFVKPELCAKFAGFTLKEQPKPRKEVYRCCGCGVFMSQYQYYSGDCRKCGTDNRP